MMAATQGSASNELCSICGKPWNKHSQPEQDSCFRKMNPSKQGGTGIG